MKVASKFKSGGTDRLKTCFK